MKLLPVLLFLATATFGNAEGLEFSEILKEIKAGPEVRQVAADFAFENKTDKPVKIARYESTCSCMNVQVKGGKLLYEPGEKGVLRANFDMGNFSGIVDKSVQLWLEGDPATAPSVNLTVRVDIPIIVNMEPKTLRWDVGGHSDSQTIEISMNYEKPIHVISAESGNEAFAIEVKTLEEGSKYQMVVTPKSVDSPALGVIQVKTDCPIERHATQRGFAIIRKPTPAEDE